MMKVKCFTYEKEEITKYHPAASLLKNIEFGKPSNVYVRYGYSKVLCSFLFTFLIKSILTVVNRSTSSK